MRLIIPLFSHHLKQISTQTHLKLLPPDNIVGHQELQWAQTDGINGKDRLPLIRGGKVKHEHHLRLAHSVARVTIVLWGIKISEFTAGRHLCQCGNTDFTFQMHK
jgi:hypothetical protein